MGFASKLAAQSAPPGQFPSASTALPYPQQRPGQYPGQPVFQPPGATGPSGSGAAQYQSYGAPQPPSGQQQSASQPTGGYQKFLTDWAQFNGLGQVFPPGHPLIDHIAREAPAKVARLSQEWHLNPEVARDIAVLGFYDIILYIDDSGSMQFEDNGTRIDDLRALLQRIALAATLFDEDGVSIRFMNSQPPPQLIDNIRNDQQIHQLLQNVQFRGLTPMGTELRRRVIDPLVLGKARAGQLKKPVLVITITDGQPGGEPANAVIETVYYAVNEMNRTQLGRKGIGFQFCQVGRDKKAQEFLGKLDKDPAVGQFIDCTSDYELENEEMMKDDKSITPDAYLMKLLLGPIDRTYDEKDEVAQQWAAQWSGGPQQNAPPPANYASRPPNQPQPGYSQQTGYGASPGQGYPSQQQYGSYQGQAGAGYPASGQGQYGGNQSSYPQQGQAQGSYQQHPPGQYSGPQGQYSPQGGYPGGSGRY